jgi:hypothetical protein
MLLQTSTNIYNVVYYTSIFPCHGNESSFELDTFWGEMDAIQSPSLQEVEVVLGYSQTGAHSSKTKTHVAPKYF